MNSPRLKLLVSRFLADYGMLLVLLLLCAYYSYVTWAEQHPTGAAGGRQLVRELAGAATPGQRVLVVAGESEEEAAFAEALRDGLSAAGFQLLGVVKGKPADARAALDGLVKAGTGLDLIAANHVSATWSVFENLGGRFPAFARTRIVTPRSYWWPDFLKRDNIRNVADQIVVIAILAVGMTMVIITGGIDLSVGSLIALSAVVSALLIRDAAGAERASALGMTLSSLGGIGVCALVGAITGMLVTFAAIPPFIATLAVMLAASGLAYLLAAGQSVYQVPASFVWLGRGIAAAGVPNAVVLMALLYIAAHVVMSQTALGRYIYAVGGNAEAARLSGVPVKRIVIFVYALCGALAGLGGVIMASQLRSGSPTYGGMYELYTIAAVVVGGTSLAGGEGRSSAPSSAPSSSPSFRTA